MPQNRRLRLAEKISHWISVIAISLGSFMLIPAIVFDPNALLKFESSFLIERIRGDHIRLETLSLEEINRLEFDIAQIMKNERESRQRIAVVSSVGIIGFFSIGLLGHCLTRILKSHNKLPNENEL
jgi:hypothetical protein